jgi:hypothetical protein
MSLERLVGLAIDQAQYVIGRSQTFPNRDLGLVLLCGDRRLRDDFFCRWSGDWRLRGNFFSYWTGDRRRYRRVTQQRAPRSSTKAGNSALGTVLLAKYALSNVTVKDMTPESSVSAM